MNQWRKERGEREREKMWNEEDEFASIHISM